ncbi:MAG: hypothetical protein ABR585_03530 [Gemmatimonadaceae bacterium]
MTSVRLLPATHATHQHLAKLFIIALFSLAVSVSGCKENAWTPMGTAELVLSQIKLGGGVAVARRIDDDEPFGQTVMNGIATGDSVWLEVAAQLTPRSAAAEASLAMALAAALPRSPTRVVSLLGERYPVSEVCSIPRLASDSLSVNSYRDSAATALAMITDSSLVNIRDACAAELERARARKLQRIDPAYVVKNKPKPAPALRRRRAVPKRQVVTPQDSTSSD